MNDQDLTRWWRELGTVATELRSAGRHEAADRLIDAVQGGATSSEILGRIGVVLRARRALRAGLSQAGRRSWDSVMADVNRNYPIKRLAEWFMRLIYR